MKNPLFSKSIASRAKASILWRPKNNRNPIELQTSTKLGLYRQTRRTLNPNNSSNLQRRKSTYQILLCKSRRNKHLFWNWEDPRTNKGKRKTKKKIAQELLPQKSNSTTIPLQSPIPFRWRNSIQSSPQRERERASIFVILLSSTSSNPSFLCVHDASAKFSQREREIRAIKQTKLLQNGGVIHSLLPRAALVLHCRCCWPRVSVAAFFFPRFCFLQFLGGRRGTYLPRSWCAPRCWLFCLCVMRDFFR